MKIATWNVERLKHQSSLDKIISDIDAVQADILVLTETDERIKPNYRYSFHTPKLHEAPADYHMPGHYKDYAVADVYAATEKRVSISPVIFAVFLDFTFRLLRLIFRKK